MIKKEKRTRWIHIALIVFIILLSAGLIFEIYNEGSGWLSKHFETGQKYPVQKQGFTVTPYNEFEIEEWDPYKEMDRIQHRMDRWFNYMLRSMPGVELKRIEMFEPEIDIAETENEYVITCDIPGMTKEGIEVSVKENYLTISGTRDIKREETKESGYYYKERRSGYFRRTVLLPGPVDENKVKAEYTNGILTIKILKVKPLEEIKPKKVQII